MNIHAYCFSGLLLIFSNMHVLHAQDALSPDKHHQLLAEELKYYEGIVAGEMWRIC